MWPPAPLPLQFLRQLHELPCRRPWVKGVGPPKVHSREVDVDLHRGEVRMAQETGNGHEVLSTRYQEGGEGFCRSV